MVKSLALLKHKFKLSERDFPLAIFSEWRENNEYLNVKYS
jgi:hypothetical protein